MEQFQKTFYFGPSNHFFHRVYKNVYYSLSYTTNIHFTTSKQQGYALEQDVQLCPFLYFPVTIAGKELGNCLCNIIGFHTFTASCVYLSADTQKLSP
jgi:hypothetical protein